VSLFAMFKTLVELNVVWSLHLYSTKFICTWFWRPW
jgi:hypothetical protein